MSHRAKNLFALAAGVVSISSRSAASVPELATSIRERLSALARAHELRMPDLAAAEAETQKATSLLQVLQAILAPYDEAEIARIQLSGADVSVGASALPSIALLLHEFGTNSAKYGALSTSQGDLAVALAVDEGILQMTWSETGSPPAIRGRTEGFGTMLERATVANQLGGSVEREWLDGGLTIRLSIPLSRLQT